MAYQIPGFSHSLISSADYSGEDINEVNYQFRFVKVDNGEVVLTDEDDVSVGVMQNRPDADQSATIYSTGVTKLTVTQGVTINAGDSVKCGDDGLAAVPDPAVGDWEEAEGIALTSTGNGAEHGELISVLLKPHAVLGV